MIEIRHTPGKIEITGHANYAEPGKDIVCAAVSTLAQTLAYSLYELTPDTMGFMSESGHMEIIYGALSDSGVCLIKSFLIGANMVAEQYPEYVNVVESRFK